MILADIDGHDYSIVTDWVAIMKKHRVLAGRLEFLANTQGKDQAGTALKISAPRIAESATISSSFREKTR